MRRILSLAVVLIWALAFPALAVADSFSYSPPLTVRESSGTARPGIAVVGTINNAYLAANGYIATTGLNTSLTTVSPSTYTLEDGRIAFFVPSLQANGSNTYNYNLGTSVLRTAVPLLFGTGGYVTTADDPALECGTGCRLNITGYMDTSYSGSPRYIFRKENAAELYVSAASTLTAALYESASLGPSG